MQVSGGALGGLAGEGPVRAIAGIVVPVAGGIDGLMAGGAAG